VLGLCVYVGSFTGRSSFRTHGGSIVETLPCHCFSEKEGDKIKGIKRSKETEKSGEGWITED
jgi:hypothetical protein